ncbi:MAG: PQQ-binding-like beta-propeller repeat protein [Chthoniobacteraceae bacterium]
MIRPLLACSILTLASFAGDSWPQFRGPLQNGVSDAKALPLEWSEQKNVKWKTEIPGEGWSSPIVGNGQIWLTTALSEGRSLRAICVDPANGKILRDIEVFKNENPPAKHKRNSYASPTGIIDGDRVFVHFGPMGTACLDAKTGSVRWENRELIYDPQNGPGGSLAMWKDKLLIACDGMDAQFEAVLDKATGKLVRKTPRDAPELLPLRDEMRKAYGTPVVMQIDGRAQSLTTASNRLYATDPETGAELWHVKYPLGFSNVPLPVSDGRMMVVSTGFMKPVLLGIKVGGAKADATATHVQWRQIKGAPDQCSPIIVGDRVYATTSGGILSCLNLQTGDIVWQERIGSDFAASPIFAAGRLYLFAAAGPCTVIKPGDSFQKLAENTLDAGCMASPAVVSDALIVRTKTHLYRIGQ